MTLQTNIDSFQDMDPGYLPPHLCMMELAYWIDKSAKARVHQYDHPWAHWIQSGNKWNNMSLLPESQIQGYSPVALCTDISGRGCAYPEDCGQCQPTQDALAHIDDTLALTVTNRNMIHSYFARHVRDVVIWRLHVICWHRLYSLQSI
jgi:hypothetical protein